MDFEGREMLTLFGLPENSICENAFFPLRRKIHTGFGTGDVSSNITLRLIRCTSQIISMKSG